MTIETGWVIEGAWSSTATPDYWVGSSAWSNDSDKALRFARRQDAQQAADLMCAGLNVRICLHEWWDALDMVPAPDGSRVLGIGSGDGGAAMKVRRYEVHVDAIGLTDMVLASDYDALAARLAEAERLLRSAAARIQYHSRGTTHYDGCELAHDDCLVLVQIDRHLTAGSAEVFICDRCGKPICVASGWCGCPVTVSAVEGK